jgi:hypothetical protein
MTETQIKALVKAREIALKYSRGEVPTRQCSPYGGLMDDTDQIKHDGRVIYEAILSITGHER